MLRLSIEIRIPNQAAEDVIAMSDDGLQRRPRQRKWHAVNIRCGGFACEAAKALKEQRFLSREVPPRLPLAACTQPEDCHCRYQHFEDRRAGNRRDDDTTLSGIRRAPEKNRRSGRGRRNTD